jgi:hypothetical protein
MRRVLALLLALLGAALAFKDAEMKKCSDLYFCRTCVAPLCAPRRLGAEPDCACAAQEPCAQARG